MTTYTTTELVSATETLLTTYSDWCDGFGDAELSTQSLCPDWDIRDVLAHAVGVEVVLDGWAPSIDTPPPFEKLGGFATELDGKSPTEVAAAVRSVATTRLDHLRSMSPDAAATPSITPTGVRTYGDFLRIRVFDLWVHAHDMAIPLEYPVDLGSEAAAIALDEVAGAVGYIVGKKVGLPDGRSAVIHITGEVERDLAVAVDGKARAVESAANADVELTADVETFILLAAGRIDPQERIDAGRITWSGDAEWGERMARRLSYTI